MDEPVRVLYIAGSGRSGSTLVANVLAQVPGCFGAGEVRYLWERGVEEHRLCGCGVVVTECPVWRAVIEEAFGSIDGARAPEVVALQRRIQRIRHLPRLLRSVETADLADYRALLARLYPAMRRVTDCDLIVDSSKQPTYGKILASLDGLDVRTLHLVRDPRATAWSWMRTKPLADAGARQYMERMSPAKSSVLWSVWNNATRRIAKRSHALRMRYEDFVAAPRARTAELLAFAGVEAEAPFIDERTIELTPSHTVAGNADRMRSGVVTVRADDEWDRAMAKRDRMLVSALTALERRRYRY
jgi:hypothetical protein